MPAQRDRLVRDARQLAARLARLSADSSWARRASGQRGALLRYVERADTGVLSREDRERLQMLFNLGHEMLAHAAREIVAPEDLRRGENKNLDPLEPQINADKGGEK